DRLRTRLAASSVRGVRLQPDLSANRRSIAWPIPAAGAVGGVLRAVLWQTRAPCVVPEQPETAADRIKGTAASGRPALAVYRRTNDGSEQLADRTVAHAGDLIRAGYRSARRP